jgi:hypothetical protein
MRRSIGIDPVRRPVSEACLTSEGTRNEMRPGNADVKYPWSWTPALGGARPGSGSRATTGSPWKWRELDDFVEANPVESASTGPARGRRPSAVSWSIGLELVRASHALDDAFWERVQRRSTTASSSNNLENTYEVTSNHPQKHPRP